MIYILANSCHQTHQNNERVLDWLSDSLSKDSEERFRYIQKPVIYYYKGPMRI